MSAEPVSIALVEYEGEQELTAVVTIRDGDGAEGAGGAVAEANLSEVQLHALVDQAGRVLREMRWHRTEFGISIGLETDHIYRKGDQKALCGLSNDDGRPLSGHPYFGGPTACLCKRCERSYKRLAEPSVRPRP